MFWITSTRRRIVFGGHRRGQGTAHRLLAPRTPGAKHVEADAGDDRCQPSAKVVDALGSGTAQPEPGLLHGVVGLGGRTEHPVGDAPEAWPALLEFVCHPFSHGHILLF